MVPLHTFYYTHLAIVSSNINNDSTSISRRPWSPRLCYEWWYNYLHVQGLWVAFIAYFRGSTTPFYGVNNHCWRLIFTWWQLEPLGICLFCATSTDTQPLLQWSLSLLQWSLSIKVAFHPEIQIKDKQMLCFDQVSHCLSFNHNTWILFDSVHG